jgi:hypothetical protein
MVAGLHDEICPIREQLLFSLYDAAKRGLPVPVCLLLLSWLQHRRVIALALWGWRTAFIGCHEQLMAGVFVAAGSALALSTRRVLFEAANAPFPRGQARRSRRVGRDRLALSDGLQKDV